MCRTELERLVYLCGMKAISAFGGSAGAGNTQRDFGPPTLTSDAGPLLQIWLRGRATAMAVLARRPASGVAPETSCVYGR